MKTSITPTQVLLLAGRSSPSADRADGIAVKRYRLARKRLVPPRPAQRSASEPAFSSRSASRFIA